MKLYLAWAGLKLGRKYATPIFDGASMDEVAAELKEAGLPNWRTYLYDGFQVKDLISQ